MDRTMWLSSLFVSLVPLLFFWQYRYGGPELLLWTGAGVIGVYLFIALVMRPSRFELGASELQIVFPVWRSRIPRTDIATARILSNRKELSAEFGKLMRVGAGGFLGGFGWLWGPKARLTMYVTRMSGWVLIERRIGRPLLLSVEDPDRFVEELNRS
jgi:hypothetical protein